MQDWKLYVPLDEYYAFVTGLEGRIALRQASKRGWLTYTDLMAVWDATDIENSMLAASQQTAKVRADDNTAICNHSCQVYIPEVPTKLLLLYELPGPCSPV